MKVAKFGGSSLATAEQLAKVCGIVEADADRRAIVVSAPGTRFSGDIKVTDLLIRLAEAKLAALPTGALLDEITSRFAAIAAGCGVPPAAADAVRKNLQQRLDADYTTEGQFMDTIKAAGEDNSARLVAEVLRARGVEANYVNPKDAGLILSDEAGQARVLPQSYDALYKLRDRQGVTIFPGFFGYAEAGHVVTFPRGGSDITGAILAAAVKADVYENFTDVDSVLTANPAFVKHAEPIKSLTYSEMRELSYAGFSVFHDEALEPVVHRGIPVNIRNTNNPASPGTLIVKRREIRAARPVVGIAAQDGFVSINIEKYLMNREVGFGRRVLQVLEDAGISYEHTPSGIDNLSVILRESFLPTEQEAVIVEALRSAVDADEVSVERGIALIMLVGEGMQHAIGLTGRAGTALGKANVNLEMINQGSSEVSMMFGVKAEEMRDAVKALYAEFFPPSISSGYTSTGSESPLTIND